MAVFRVERTRDYTVMCNHHLKDSNLSLKAKGLLSMMLSLPDEWNYTTRGLAAICKEGVDAIGKTLKELELAGYIIRRQLRGKDGRISDTEYTIFEKPRKPSPPDTSLPDTENPYLDILQVGVQVRCRCPDRNKHMDDCDGRVRCRPKRRCQRLRADYRRHQHQHFKRHGGH